MTRRKGGDLSTGLDALDQSGFCFLSARGRRLSRWSASQGRMGGVGKKNVHRKTTNRPSGYGKFDNLQEVHLVAARCRHEAGNHRRAKGSQHGTASASDPTPRPTGDGGIECAIAACGATRVDFRLRSFLDPCFRRRRSASRASTSTNRVAFLSPNRCVALAHCANDAIGVSFAGRDAPRGPEAPCGTHRSILVQPDHHPV